MTANRIDFGAGMVTVDRQLSRSRQLAPPKSALSTRTMPFRKWLMTDLAAVVARRGIDCDSDEFLFVTRDRGPLDYTNWRIRTWIPACEEADLSGLRFHDLRSLAATALISAGVDVKTAQTRLGHVARDPCCSLPVSILDADVVAEGEATRVGRSRHTDVPCHGLGGPGVACRNR